MAAWTISYLRAVRQLAAAALVFSLLAATSANAASPHPPFVPGVDRIAGGPDRWQETAGSLLLTELSCTACHRTKLTRLRPKRGPQLDGVANRLRPSWLRRFLAAPGLVKPGTTMPHMLAELDTGQQAAALDALVAYLSSLQNDSQFHVNSTASAPLVSEFWNQGSRERGKELYHQVGCVACHKPDQQYPVTKSSVSDREQLARLGLEPDEIAALRLKASSQPVRSVPLGVLSDKYDRRSLTFFLLDPLKTRPSGRMPSMKLHPEEAADIVSYLIELDAQPEVTLSPNVDLATAGRRLFGDLGCSNCHQVNDAPAEKPSIDLSLIDLDAVRSCAKQPRAGLPNYSLDKPQQDAIRDAVQQIQRNPDGSERAPTVLWTLLQLNCVGCHQRGEYGGVGPRRRPYFETSNPVDLGDEGRLPPLLDGVGRKFKTAWIKEILSGSGDVRPHMLARMPNFGSVNVDQLPEQLVKADRATIDSRRNFLGQSAPEPDAGRVLLDAGCVQCHPLRGEALPGVVGIDLAGVQRRLEPQWFYDFLLDPAALKARTRMPTFFAGGKSPTPAVLEGDVVRQIEAMWSYLGDIQNQQLPQKLAEGKLYNFELVPGDRPVVLRTFMKAVGTHAIAVGFPQQVHLALDAQQVRLSQAWRGRFLDAHGTWFDRFTPLARPLGDDVVQFPLGVPFAKLADRADRWPSDTGEQAGYRFGGYRLDRHGTPTFLYEFDQFAVEDRLEPAGPGLARRLRITVRGSREAQPHSVWFRAAVGGTLTSAGNSGVRVDSKLTILVSEETARLGQLRVVNGQSEWLIPLEIREPKMFEVRYQW